MMRHINKAELEHGFTELKDSIYQYPTLPENNQRLLRTWASSTGNFATAVFKFLSGCITGSGFLCVSALYSFLLGLAKRQVITGGADREEAEPYCLLRRMGLYILVAGGVYGVYLGRLILYPERAFWRLPVGILIALYTFIDVGLAVYTLFQNQEDYEESPLLFGQKLMTLATALPMIVMTQIVLNSYASQVDTSAFDGRFGAAVGLVILDIGAGIVLYANKKLKEEKSL